jgi:hypothetical protein
MNKQNYHDIEKAMDDQEGKKMKKSVKKMKVSGKGVINLAKIISKKKK